MANLVKFSRLDDLLAHVEEIERTQSAADAARSMCEVYLASARFSRFASTDPFSPEYAEMCAGLHRELAGVSSYDPFVNERTPYVDVARSISAPSPYNYGESATISDFLLSWGWIFRNLDVKAGARVLEYGAGDGQISIQLARMGCEVSIVDIDERYLAAVGAQCDRLGLPYLLDVHGTENGWYAGEGTHRWTGARALFTLPESMPASSATFTLVNHLPVPRRTLLRCGPFSSEANIQPGQRASLAVRIPPERSSRLELVTTMVRARDVNPAIADDRQLGIGVQSLRLTPRG